MLHYFPCVAQVFTKYRLSFKLSECNLFKDRVEYVGHDLTTEGNCPVVSKFFLQKDWSLSPHGKSLLLFIRICCFYNRYYPWFETNINPLRKLQRNYHRKNIPMMGWTPAFIKIVCDYKIHLVTSPLLLPFDSTRPIFLKTYCSAGGMG